MVARPKAPPSLTVTDRLRLLLARSLALTERLRRCTCEGGPVHTSGCGLLLSVELEYQASEMHVRPYREDR